jgi:NAD(P)-dependent dehydrogenase (short-subunit alcohol dehydrogenase family)
MITTEWSCYNIQAYTVTPTVILTEMDQKAWGEARKRDPIKTRIPSRRFS